MQESTAPVTANLVGSRSIKIWGLPLAQWQERALNKAGAVLDGPNANVHLGVNWVLSSALLAALINRPKTALIVDGIIIAIHNEAFIDASDLIGKSAEGADFDGLTPVSPDDIAGSYNKALRKSEPPYALNVDTTKVIDIERRQYGSSYKGITDFVTKFFWPVPAFYFTRLCASLRLTPNMVTTLSLIMTFAALYFFWQGQWALGFITGWFMTFLDTVDGKLARTTMTYSAWGNIYDHGIDLIHPPFWYWAWFAGLTGYAWGATDGSNLMMAALLAIWAGYVVDRLIEGLFIMLHGFHIHVWRPINSGLRFITARRNPNMFIFMIGILCLPLWPESGKNGFYAVAIWTWACIAFNIGVVLVSMAVRKPIESWMDKNA